MRIRHRLTAFPFFFLSSDQVSGEPPWTTVCSSFTGRPGPCSSSLLSVLMPHAPMLASLAQQAVATPQPALLTTAMRRLHVRTWLARLGAARPGLAATMGPMRASTQPWPCPSSLRSSPQGQTTPRLTCTSRSSIHGHALYVQTKEEDDLITSLPLVR